MSSRCSPTPLKRAGTLTEDQPLAVILDGLRVPHVE
jgi:hypothetical protein